MAVSGILKWAVIFFVIAVVAAIFGFGGIVSAAVDIGKFLFFVFVVLFVIAIIVGLIRR